MDQRVLRLLAALPALFQIEGAVEIRMRVAALLCPFLQIMNQRVEVAVRDVGIGRQVVFGVEQPRSSYRLIVAEQRVHNSCLCVNRAVAQCPGGGHQWL